MESLTTLKVVASEKNKYLTNVPDEKENMVGVERRGSVNTKLRVLGEHILWGDLVYVFQFFVILVFFWV